MLETGLREGFIINTKRSDNRMKIEVKNDNKIVFVGKAEDFLLINECDPDIEDMVLEAKKEGIQGDCFFSGCWEVTKI